jgi:hypothetical protein
MENTLVTLDQTSIDAIIQGLQPFYTQTYSYIQLVAGLILGALLGVVFWSRL